MWIQEVGQTTGLTKKAIIYYIEQGLLCPAVLDNGYREFSEKDIEQLKRIFVLRKLGLTIKEMKAALADESGTILKKLSIQKRLQTKQEEAKEFMLDQLSIGRNYDEISELLNGIEKNTIIAEKLLEIFPGYFGRFICLHFARFLDIPAITQKQQNAFEKMVDFLDNSFCKESMHLNEELQAALASDITDFTLADMEEMQKHMEQSVEEPEKFIAENKEVLESYMEFRQSEVYKQTPGYQLQVMLKEMMKESGYYDVFIPAMRELSPHYENYMKNLEATNEILLSRYPKLVEGNQISD